MRSEIFLILMAWIRSLTIAVCEALTARSFKAWVYSTGSVIIATTGAFFYIGAVQSIVGWSLAPLHFFFYPLTWLVIIGAPIVASTFAIIMTGYQDGFDHLPICSPLFVAKETITFPIWFFRFIFQILHS